MIDIFITYCYHYVYVCILRVTILIILLHIITYYILLYTIIFKLCNSVVFLKIFVMIFKCNIFLRGSDLRCYLFKTRNNLNRETT